MNKPETKVFILRDNAIRDRFTVAVNAIPIGDDEPLIKGTLEVYRKDRSAAQNRLMWMWLGEISRHLYDERGIKNTAEDLKDHFQRNYLGWRMYNNPGNPSVSEATINNPVSATRVIGTSELNTAQFTEFLTHIDVYASAELGLTLPHPEDVYYEAMGK